MSHCVPEVVHSETVVLKFKFMHKKCSNEHLLQKNNHVTSWYIEKMTEKKMSEDVHENEKSISTQSFCLQKYRKSEKWWYKRASKLLNFYENFINPAYFSVLMVLNHLGND